jgi:hypothetical protein
MKGILFGGCSFTWGQGLYYYSDLPNLEKPEPFKYDPKKILGSHRRFVETKRFPRLVADYFGTFEVVKRENGGSEDESFRFFDRIFSHPGSEKHEYITGESFKYEDFDYLILQVSQPGRNNIKFNYEGKDWEVQLMQTSEKEVKKAFFCWLIDNEKTYEMWHKEFIGDLFYKIKEKLKFYESKGIKTKILFWFDDYMNLIHEDEFMRERYIPLNYRNEHFSTIDQMMKKYPYLEISKDAMNFQGFPPKDDHPSLKCHEIIADAIINSIGYDLKPKPKNLTADDHIPIPGIELINKNITTIVEEKPKKRSII